MARSASRRSPRSARKLTAQQQGIAIGGATLVSVIYATQITYYFIPEAPPFQFAFWTLASILLLVFVGLCVTGGPLEALAAMMVGAPTTAEAASERSVRVLAVLWYAALYALSIGCIWLLGWLTASTGGSLKSPFAATLLVVVSLAPVVARSMWTILGIVIWVSVVFFVFLQDQGGTTEVQVPIWVTILSVVFSVVIGLTIEVLRRRFTHDDRTPISDLITQEDGGHQPGGGRRPDSLYFPDEGYEPDSGYNPDGGYEPDSGYNPDGGYEPDSGYNPDGGGNDSTTRRR